KGAAPGQATSTHAPLSVEALAGAHWGVEVPMPTQKLFGFGEGPCLTSSASLEVVVPQTRMTTSGEFGSALSIGVKCWPSLTPVTVRFGGVESITKVFVSEDVAPAALVQVALTTREPSGPKVTAGQVALP